MRHSSSGQWTDIVARMGPRILRYSLFASLICLAVLAGVAAWGHAQYVRPGPLSAQTDIVIPRGGGLKAIARQLEVRGVISSARIFEIAARLDGEATALHAGEYSFPVASSAQQALAIIKSGKTVLRRFTIAEGLTSAQIINQLAKIDGLSGDVYFGLPDEGSLLPETYYFSYGEDRQDVVERMRQGMAALLDELWQERDEGLPLKSAYEALILAAIVEKETGLAEERPHVAAVFINRLRRGMRLQSDPTVAYGITGGSTVLDRGLRRSELKAETPYNTYVIKGLPPGPIANPGRAAIEAVLHPVASKDLYFVADGSGGHAFARSLNEHNRNVAAWRKIEAARKP